MALLDELGRKISQTGQNALQKTKDITDTAKINGAISEEERKIADCYLQIGKLYAKLHPDDYEADFADIMSAIQESENRISGFLQLIQDIRGVICCTNCGAEIANTAAFCSACGAPAPKQENMAASAKQCLNCGAEIEEDAHFCRQCGRPV